MDFKWTLSRPGIELEFETGSIKEALGLLESEGTQISEVFGVFMGGKPAEQGAPEAPKADEPAKRTRGPNKNKEAVAPPPLPVPTSPPTATTLPPNALAPAIDGGIPPFLQRTAPPLAPLPPATTLAPKVVAALDVRKATSPDGGQALADWLASHGLTVPGASYDEACRALLFIADEKLAAAAAQLGVS